MSEIIDAPQRATNDAEAEAERILDIARTRLEATEGAYTGAVTPPEAWRLYKEGQARLVDVRTAPEVRYVGCVPGALQAEWHGSDPAQVERFLHDLRAVAHQTRRCCCCVVAVCGHTTQRVSRARPVIKVCSTSWRVSRVSAIMHISAALSMAGDRTACLGFKTSQTL